MCELCPRWELPGSSLHQLPAGTEGQPVQPLVLQQGLLPLLPRRTTSNLLVQDSTACLHPNSNSIMRKEMGTFVYMWYYSYCEQWEETKSQNWKLVLVFKKQSLDLHGSVSWVVTNYLKLYLDIRQKQFVSAVDATLTAIFTLLSFSCSFSCFFSFF